MKTIRKIEIEPVWVEFIPEQLEDNKLYISLDYSVAIHNCLCGCGNKVVTPINHGNIQSGWNYSESNGKVSLSPSIGNYNFPCKYHYILTNNVANVV